MKGRRALLLCALLASGPVGAAAQDTVAIVRALGAVLKQEYIDINVAAHDRILRALGR